MSASFEPARFERIHSLLLSALADPSTAARDNAWYIALDRSRAELVDLGRPKPPSDAERSEIEKGKLTWQGSVHDLNADFAQQTLVLARSYGISERYAASLLQAGLSERARFRRPALDTACLRYHRERLALLACLKELVRGVITLGDDAAEESDGLDDDARALGAKMEQLAVTLCSTPVELRQGFTATGSADKGKASSRGQLPERLLEELRYLRQQADTIRQQMTGGNGNATQALSDEIQLHRLECVEREAKEVGHVVYLLAVARLLRQPESAEALASWLAALGPQDLEARATPVVYILTTLLAVIDGALSDSGFTQDALQGDGGVADKRDALLRLHQHLTSKAKWGDARLKGVVMLQWALLLVEAIRADPSLGTELRLSDQGLQTIMMEAIESDALVFILLRVLAFRRKALADDDDEALDELNGNAAATDALALRQLGETDVDDEFQEYVLQQTQALIFKLTSTALPLLRRMQRTEEDAAFASSRAGALGATSKPRAAARRYDIEALFDLVALICKGRAEVSLPLWLGLEGRGTTRFLAWAFDVREPGHQRALLEMLAALTAGPQSAWHAHTALSAASLNTADAGETRLVSWQRLMDWVAFYVDSFRSLSSQQALAGMPPDEAVLLRAFLRLLRNVAAHSVAAREALYEAADLTIVPRLFALYICPIPVELKGALLDALAAFARSDGNNAPRIIGDLWSMLEHSQVLGSAGGASASKRSSLLRGSLAAPAPPTRGVLFELENVESPSRSYPGTVAFINFLTALIPSSAPGQSPAELATALIRPTKNGSAVAPRPAQQQPSYLGLVEPYVGFVVDSVLSTLGSREFATPRDRWQLVSACLGFVERCLYAYDVSALSPDAKTEVLSAQLPALALHPGFDIVKRILTGGKLLGDVLGVLNPAGGGAGFDIINAHRAGTPLFAAAVKSALRIVRRTLSIQDRYLRTLLPSLGSADGSAPGINSTDSVTAASPAARVGQLSAYSSLDTHLLRAHQAVVQIALYVNCQRADVALLSVRVLALIARSDAFSSVDRFGQMGYGRKMNRLVGLLDMSEEADRVCGGYVHWMDSVGEGGEVEDVDAADESPLEALDAPSPSAEEAIKLAILDMLLEQTSTDKPAPNVAWLLLGYNLRAVRPEEQAVPDPDSDEAVRSVLHSVLQTLNTRSSTSLASPAVLERGHALVLRLCSHPLTSAATLRYLRTREDFFARQIRRVTAAVRSPVTGSLAAAAAPGSLVFSDGQSFPSTVDAIVSATRTKAHILNGAALELHTLCSTELLGPATHLVAALVGSAAVLPTSEALGAGDETLDDGDDFDGDNDGGLIPTSSAFGGATVTQSSSRLLTLLQGFDFEWHDERESLVSELNLLRELNLDLARAATPEREFDSAATIHILSAARRELETRGDLADASRRAAFAREAEIVLAYVACRNAQRALALARRSALQAWRSSLDIIVARCSHLVRAEARIALAFDVLAGLLPKLAGPSPETDSSLTDTFAAAALSLLTSLRQQQRGLVAAASIADHSLDLPADRLFQTLRSLLSALTQTGVLTASSRGNLYSALVNFLQLIQEAAQSGAGAEAAEVESLLADDELTTLEDDGASLTGLSVAGTVHDRSSSAVLVSRTRNLIASQLDRLLPIVARDALDASDIWRTVAFTLLDRLCAIEFGKGSGTAGKAGTTAALAAATRSLEILGRSGLLRTFSASLRDMDAALQDVLRPDPVGLNALYVYEAQLAFLNRLALTKAGATRLIEDARIFEVLAQVDVLSARPEHGQDFIDLDSFLPAAMERYNAIVSPALQLAVGLLSSSANSGPTTLAPGSAGLRNATTLSAHAAPRQALAFLDAHHAAMLAILKAPLEETTSLASVTQAQLIVSLLTFVLPHLGDDALGGAGSLSSFHDAVLALCAGFLQAPAWKGRVVPYTDSERLSASRPSVQGSSALPSAAPASAMEADRREFDDEADEVVEGLVSALLSYVVASTNVSAAMAVAPEPGKNLRIRSCLTPSLYAYTTADDGAGVDEEMNGNGGRFGLSTGVAARANAAAPTLGMALAALESRGRAVTAALSNVETFNAMLVQPDAVRLEEWDEFLRRAAASDELPAGLSPAQRRTLAVRELKRRKHVLLARSVTRLDDMEKLLVVLFRHFDYFLSLPATTLLADSEARRRGLAARASVAPRAVDGGGPSSRRLTFVRDSATRVKDALQEVEQAILALGASASAALGRGRVRERQAFLEMAGRKLGAVLLEHEEAASAMAGQ